MKDLSNLPIFTLRDVEDHRKKSGKLKGHSIRKTLLKGKKFKDEGYILRDSIFTLSARERFKAKCMCRASMRKDWRRVIVHILRATSKVVYASCTCPAGNSGYCNHVMALLLTLVDYSTQLLELVPEDTACTSSQRKWGCPVNKDVRKFSVMGTILKKQPSSSGITPTLYDPRLNIDQSTINARVDYIQTKLIDEDPRIGFAHIAASPDSLPSVRTEYGSFKLGSPLSFHLQPVDPAFNVLSNLKILSTNELHVKCADELPSLPLQEIGSFSQLIPTWNLTNHEMQFLKTLKINLLEARNIEKRTIQQSLCPEWFALRENRITSSNAHKVITRQKKFESLAENIIFPKEVKSRKLKDALNYGRNFESVARQSYIDIMKFKLNHDICVRETGIVIQPSLYWLAASPDGMVSDKESTQNPGLIEIKCPFSKRNATPLEMVHDKSFYVEMENGHPVLKNTHSSGYYTQIQMALGLSGLTYCDFIVYSLKGCIIIRIPFDLQYFEDAVKKLNRVYKEHFLAVIIEKCMLSDAK